ncbi:MAG TPA: hypothetical protein VF633_06675 [Brevundimonas sp.]|jgi:hypothetical protein
MTRRLNVQRVIGGLGVVVLGLGALSLWAISHGARPGFSQEQASDRVLRQAHEQLGPRAEIRLLQTGRGRVVCGYLAADSRSSPSGFVSRPNRLLLSNDPLKGEFDQMVAQDCPAFPAPPRTTQAPG